jgi:hypothetical protein
MAELLHSGQELDRIIDGLKGSLSALQENATPGTWLKHMLGITPTWSAGYEGLQNALAAARKRREQVTGAFYEAVDIEMGPPNVARDRQIAAQKQYEAARQLRQFGIGLYENTGIADFVEAMKGADWKSIFAQYEQKQLDWKVMMAPGPESKLGLPPQMDWGELIRTERKRGNTIYDYLKWQQREGGITDVSDIPTEALQQVVDSHEQVAERMVMEVEAQKALNREIDIERELQAAFASKYLSDLSKEYKKEMDIWEARILQSEVDDKTLADLEKEYKLREDLFALDERRRQIIADTAPVEQQMLLGVVGSMRSYAKDIANFYEETFAAVGDVLQGFQDTISSVLFDAMTDDMKSWKEYTISILKSVAKAIADLGAQMLALGIFKGLAGIGLNFFGAGAQTAGTFTGNAASLSTATGTNMAGIPLFTGAQFGGITNGPVIAGEAGPEAIVPLPHGRKIPVEMKGSGGGGNTFQITINAVDGPSVQRMLYQNRDYVVGLFERAIATKPTTRRNMRGV